MSITDELREEVRGSGLYVYAVPQTERLTAIADRIDAEHEAKVSYWQGASYKDGYDEGFAGADDWLAQHEDAMAEHGWIRLPKDADGVYIRIGDELDYLEALHTDVPARFKVQDMFYFGKGEWRLRAYPATYEPKKCRHHHAPTVEDVLTEMFAKAIERGELTNGAAQTIAEYASKLQLREDA